MEFGDYESNGQFNLCPDLTTMPAGFINQEYKLRQENLFKFEQKSAIKEVNSIG
jgi:hypothetical protein